MGSGRKECTHLRTLSAERRRVRGERSRDRPFFNQLIWGRGLPTAWHSSVTMLSREACTSWGVSVIPSMDGGTMTQKHNTQISHEACSNVLISQSTLTQLSKTGSQLTCHRESEDLAFPPSCTDSQTGVCSRVLWPQSQQGKSAPIWRQAANMKVQGFSDRITHENPHSGASLHGGQKNKTNRKC